VGDAPARRQAAAMAGEELSRRSGRRERVSALVCDATQAGALGEVGIMASAGEERGFDETEYDKKMQEVYALFSLSPLQQYWQPPPSPLFSDSRR
jgi:hypothetical protein